MWGRKSYSNGFMLEEISEQTGFNVFNCDKGVSSNVLVKDGDIYKISTRNSLDRSLSDYEELMRLFAGLGFSYKLPNSEIFECLSGGNAAVCVKQRIIDGKTLAQVGKTQLEAFLRERPQDLYFLKLITCMFLVRLKLKKLYPDLVGNPEDQSLFNSINLMLQQRDGLILCDVGLSPHEQTLRENGEAFFDSQNVRHYQQKMTEALKWLDGIN